VRRSIAALFLLWIAAAGGAPAAVTAQPPGGWSSANSVATRSMESGSQARSMGEERSSATSFGGRGFRGGGGR